MPDIRHLIDIEATPSAILTLVGSAKGLSAWWAADVTEPAANVFEVGLFGRSTVHRLRYVEGTVGRIAFLCESEGEWRGTQLWFELATRETPGGGTSPVEVRLTHSDWTEETDFFLRSNTTWGELMYRLKRAAEGSSPGPLFLTDRLADRALAEEMAR